MNREIHRPSSTGDPTDVAIIGGGPIGLELAVSLRHHGVSLRHFEAGTIGQTITWYPREVRFFSSPERIALAGVPFLTAHQEKATREEYLSYLRAIVGQFGLAVETYKKVTALRATEAGFRLEVVDTPEAAHGDLGHTSPSDPEVVEAKRVVIAIGDMHRPRALDIPGEDLPHVTHYFTEPHAYFGKRVLVIGGKNSAVEAALRCHRAGAEVAISYRRDAFPAQSVKAWLLPDLNNLVASGQIAFHPETEPVEIVRDAVRLRDTRTKSETEVAADFVLAMTGYAQDPTLFERAGVALIGTNRRPDVNLETMETNVPGLFAAGTAVAGTQGKFQLFIENSHPKLFGFG